LAPGTEEIAKGNISTLKNLLTMLTATDLGIFALASHFAALQRKRTSKAVQEQ